MAHVGTIPILVASVCLALCAVTVIEPARMSETVRRLLRIVHARKRRSWPHD